MKYIITILYITIITLLIKKRHEDKQTIQLFNDECQELYRKYSNK